jgi:hypothetical protein
MKSKRSPSNRRSLRTLIYDLGRIRSATCSIRRCTDFRRTNNSTRGGLALSRHGDNWDAISKEWLGDPPTQEPEEEKEGWEICDRPSTEPERTHLGFRLRLMRMNAGDSVDSGDVAKGGSAPSLPNLRKSKRRRSVRILPAQRLARASTSSVSSSRLSVLQKTSGFFSSSDFLRGASGAAPMLRDCAASCRKIKQQREVGRFHAWLSRNSARM